VARRDFGKAGLFHPADAADGRVVEPFASFDQHVPADQRPERVLASLVIDYGLVDDERPAKGQA
jgi:hypothetical protein